MWESRIGPSLRGYSWGNEKQRQALYIFNLSLVFTLILAFIPVMPMHTLRAQPLLLALAAENLSEPIRVIVQKNVQDQSVEERVVSLGGHIIKQLRIINATLVDLPAAAIPVLAEFSGVHWISLDTPVLENGGDGNVILRDDFDRDLSGLGSWAGRAWQEIGEHDGAESGDVALVQFLGGELQGLRLQNGRKGIQGFVNLADAASAALNLSYRRKDFDDDTDFVLIEASNDEGATWREVGRLAGPATDPGIDLATYDLSPYLGANFTLRFMTSDTFDVSDKFYLDFLQIDYTPKTAEIAETSLVLDKQIFLPLMAKNGTSLTTDHHHVDAVQVGAANSEALYFVLDAFDSNAFWNNHGSQSWVGNWIENDPGGAGVGKGHLRVSNGVLRLDDNPDSGGYPSAARQVDLSGVATAQLTFSFRTETGVDPSDAVVVEVSKDGGATYTVLETFTGITGATHHHRRYDITRFATNNFMVRFRVLANYDAMSEFFYLDEVRVDYDHIHSGSGWTVLVPCESVWKYLNDGSNQGSAWRSLAFDDKQWAEGGAELGYGENDETTLVGYGNDPNHKPITTYLRRTFYVADAHDFTDLTIKSVFDDGVVIYLNGQEVVRSMMPEGNLAYTTTASEPHAGDHWNTFYIPATMLVDGENVIAAEVHQVAPNSPNLSFDLELGGNSNCIDCVNTANLANVGLRTIGAETLWNSEARIQGQGVTVAVVDSGIASHPDTVSALQSSRILQHVNFVSTQNGPDDQNGHGSHIAGIIGGNGAYSNGSYLGVAPKVNLLDVQVTDDHGRGTTADVVAGLEWILNNKSAYNIRVVNMSLNSAVAQSYHTSPLNAAVEILWFNGVVVVVSAGNNGSSSNGVLYPPANDPFVITVGAVDDRGTSAMSDDLIPTFSAYGTTSDGFAKPDLVAPGRNIISLLASDDSNLAFNHAANKVAGFNGNRYFRMSGTSMASAVAAGAVALLLQDEPNLTPDQVKFRLKATANQAWSGYNAAKAGAGYLNIDAAVNETSTTSANTGIAASQLLWTGSSPVVWGSVNWNSVNWNSVNWNSVNWNSVNWNSVNWNSDYWDE